MDIFDFKLSIKFVCISAEIILETLRDLQHFRFLFFMTASELVTNTPMQ